RPGRDYDHACAHAWFDSEEVRTVHRTVGTPDVVDAGRVQCAGAVAVHIHADLDDPHELHEVHDRLPKPVSVPDDHLRRCRIEPFAGLDDVVAVLVDAAPTRGERHGTAYALVDD